MNVQNTTCCSLLFVYKGTRPSWAAAPRSKALVWSLEFSYCMLLLRPDVLRCFVVLFLDTILSSRVVHDHKERFTDVNDVFRL